MSDYTIIRQQLYTTMMKSVEAGLTRLSAGNISVRTPDGHVAITPSGIHYDELKPAEISIVDLNGNLIDGSCKPSSETPMHTAIFRALPHVGSICHTHSTYAMIFAVLGEEIPVVNLELLMCGGPIPVAEWACPGTQQAGEQLVEILQHNPALKVVLLRNHGLVSMGKTLKQAFEFAYDAEVGASVYHQALQIGEPIVLTTTQINEVYTTYGIKEAPPVNQKMKEDRASEHWLDDYLIRARKWAGVGIQPEPRKRPHRSYR